MATSITRRIAGPTSASCSRPSRRRRCSDEAPAAATVSPITPPDDAPGVGHPRRGPGPGRCRCRPGGSRRPGRRCVEAQKARLAMTAGIYARVSTLDQEPENQLQELRRYVEARGWAFTEFVDRG